MNQENKEKLANIYNILSTMLPIPSEEYSEKHYVCLKGIREILLEEAKDDEMKGS